MTGDGGRAGARVSRRRILKGGALVAGASLASISGVTQSWAARRRRVYKLNPDWGSGPKCQPDPHKISRCHACAACHRHAKNKLFATKNAVEFAHPYCNCKIVQRYISRSKWIALFGPPSSPRRTAVDKRWPWVRRILNGR